MNVLIREILEFAGLGGLILMISFVTLTKMALGSVLTLVGAFFPSKQEDKTAGQAAVKLSKITAAFKGSVRYGVIAAGIVLIFGAIIDGVHDIKSGGERSSSRNGDFIGTTSQLQQEIDAKLREKIAKEYFAQCRGSKTDCIDTLLGPGELGKLGVSETPPTKSPPNP